MREVKKGDGASNKTIARKLAAISSLFKHMIDKNQVKTNPLLSIKRPRPDARHPTQVLSAKDVKNILDLAYQNKSSGHFTTFYWLLFLQQDLEKVSCYIENLVTLKKLIIFLFWNSKGKVQNQVKKDYIPFSYEPMKITKSGCLKTQGR